MVDTNLSSKSESYYQNIREDMLQFIPAGARRTLELGCGEGNFSALLKDRLNAETWAVEINERSAKKAATKLYKVINDDAFNCLAELPDGYFDCIICFDFLEHLADPYSLLTALKTKAAGDGVFVTSIPNIRYYSVFKDFVFHGNWDYKDQGVLDKTHLRFFTYKSIIKMFEKLGFEILLTKGIHSTRSRTCKIIQLLTFNFFSDIRYKHFVSVVRPKN